MPYKPKRPCSYPGCPRLTEGRFCSKHKRERDREYNKKARPHKKLYKSAGWQRLRKWFLSKHPLCKECERQGRITSAQVVDHIKPHRGDLELFWDVNNLQALCKSCHDRKTAKKDNRWGKKGVVYSY